MSLSLLKHCLDSDFYIDHKDDIDEDLFRDNQLWKLFGCVEEHFQDSQSNLSEEGLQSLYLAKYSAITPAQVEQVQGVIEDLKEVEFDREVAKGVIKSSKISTQATDLAEEALNIAQGKHDLDTLDPLYEKLRHVMYQEDKTVQEVAGTEYDLILDSTNVLKWKFHLPQLREWCDGVGDNTFTIIGARPNAGKTAFVVSSIAHPGGWADQGARVLYLANEESVTRTRTRMVDCYTGTCRKEIVEKAPEHERIAYRKIINSKINAENLRETMVEANCTTIVQGFDSRNTMFEEISGNIHTVDVVGLTLPKMSKIIEKYTPDIVIIDQIDKVKVAGRFNGRHEELGMLYAATREVGKTYNIAMVGVTQASAEAEGKMHYSYDLLAGDKTNKGGDADTVITLGKEGFAKTQGIDNGMRAANFCKNKTGNGEGYATFMLEPQYSRIKP